MLDPRAQLLRAALGFSTAPCPRMTESCTRLVHLAGLVGRDRARHRGDAPCFDLQLTQYDEKGWRATFYTTGMEHSPTSATGTGWERTPWHATQRAAWEILDAAMTLTGWQIQWNRMGRPFDEQL